MCPGMDAKFAPVAVVVGYKFGCCTGGDINGLSATPSCAISLSLLDSPSSELPVQGLLSFFKPYNFTCWRCWVEQDTVFVSSLLEVKSGQGKLWVIWGSSCFFVLL